MTSSDESSVKKLFPPLGTVEAFVTTASRKFFTLSPSPHLCFPSVAAFVMSNANLWVSVLACGSLGNSTWIFKSGSLGWQLCVKIRGRGSKKKKIMTWILFVLFVGRHYCAVSSSFVCAADFLMRCFWRGMTERPACSVEGGVRLKEMSKILFMVTSNANPPPSPPSRCPAGCLAALLALRGVALV